MAISGLVLTLSEDPAQAARALATLADDPRLTVGERFGRKVALVGEAGGVEADRRLWEELHAIPGVEFVDVTFVALDNPDGAATLPRPPQEPSHAQG